MPLSEDELEQLRKVLYTHLLVLDTLLSSPDRWVLDLHIPIAGQLRVLLCDSKSPVLLTCAKERGIPLRVWGPRPGGIGLHTELLFSFHALVASWQPVSGRPLMTETPSGPPRALGSDLRADQVLVATL